MNENTSKWFIGFILSTMASLVMFSLSACSDSDGSSDGPSDGGGETPVIAPVINSIDPEVNDSSVILGSAISATFDKDMNPASANSFVVYGAQTGKLAGAYTGGGSETLRFDSNNKFKIGETIEVILTSQLTSIDGGPLQNPVVFRFWAETFGGSGSFTVIDTVSGQTGARGMATGDWDDDGDIDLAIANFGDDTVTVLQNDGSGDFSTQQTIAGLFGASALVAGDWDEDSDLDLAVANFTANNIVIFENDGTGRFSEDDTIINQVGASDLIAGDWDGFGDLDLAVTNFGANEIVILINDGAGRFSEADTIANQIGARALAAADWDTDGDLDLAVTNNSADSVSILENNN